MSADNLLSTEGFYPILTDHQVTQTQGTLAREVLVAHPLEHPPQIFLIILLTDHASLPIL